MTKQAATGGLTGTAVEGAVAATSTATPWSRTSACSAGEIEAARAPALAVGVTRLSADPLNAGIAAGTETRRKVQAA